MDNGVAKIINRYILYLQKEHIKFDKVYLFGSYAKSKQSEYSDIDLAFISDNKKLAKEIQSELRSLEQIHEIEINVMFFEVNICYT